MTTLLAEKTLAAINQAIEADQDDSPGRAHLGASIIGRDCSRELWYTFRWVAKKLHHARILRLFARGQDEENRFNAYLKQGGLTVWDVAPETGEQWRISDVGGHFGGSLDGVVLGLPDAPEVPHVSEQKTHNTKSFNAVVRQGVLASKPEHFAQMQIYMHKMDLKWALYQAVNKDNDDLYFERVVYDQQAAEQLLRKAKNIIASEGPLERMSDDPTWYKCKFCDYHPVCHTNTTPAMNCRTCAHSTPVLTGTDGQWKCGKHEKLIDKAAQTAGCDHHNFIPPLLANWAEATDTDGDSVTYTNKLTGNQFVNGPSGYLSSEIAAAEDPRIIGDATTDSLRQAFNGKVSD